MINRILLISLIAISIPSLIKAQYIYKIKADSVRIYNDSCTAELILENSTKDTVGFLYNKGNGRTEFRRALIPLGNMKYLIGRDTFDLSSINSYNLQKVTTLGNRTSNSIQAKGLVIGDTAHNISSLTSNIAAGYINVFGNISADSAALGAVAFGKTDSGSIRASNWGAMTFGYTQGANSIIRSTNTGSLTFGRAVAPTAGQYGRIDNLGNSSLAFGTTNGGSISTSATGSYGAFAGGNAQYFSSIAGSVQSNNVASFAFGSAYGGQIISAGYGSFAQGTSQTSSTMTASGSGSFAQGASQTGSTMTASGAGSFAQGYSQAGSTMTASNYGSFAHGYAQRKSSIISSGLGSTAQGIASDSLANGTASSINATFWGSFANGYAGYAGFGQVGSLNSNGRGSFANGWAQSGTITAQADGSFAGGHTAGSGLIYNGGISAFMWGDVSGSDSLYNTGAGSFLIGAKIYNTGLYSQVFGYGLRNTVNNSFKIGNNIEAINYNGTAQTLSFGVPVIYTTQTAPATPAAGTMVEWWDGTNKRWKKPDGSTGIIY
jgi:hypothetical protein